MDDLPLLFVKKDGSPMDFSMPICPEKKRIASIVQARGGNLVSVVGGSHTIRIVSNQNQNFSNEEICFNASFVEDCHRMNKLLNINNYRLDGRPAADATIFNRILLGELSWFDKIVIFPPHQRHSDDSSNNESTSYFMRVEDFKQFRQQYTKGRREYTSIERNQIMRYIIDTNNLSETNGRAMWVEMEKKKVIPGRTWQSMKEHFLKKIIPLHLHECALSDYEKKVVISRFPMAKKILNGNGSKVNVVPMKSLLPKQENSAITDFFNNSDSEDRNQRKEIFPSAFQSTSSSNSPTTATTSNNIYDNHSTVLSEAASNIGENLIQLDNPCSVNQNTDTNEDFMETDDLEDDEDSAEEDTSFDSDMIDEMESETLEFDKEYVEEICSKRSKSQLLSSNQFCSTSNVKTENCVVTENLKRNHSNVDSPLTSPKRIKVNKKENSLLLGTPVSRRPKANEIVPSEVNFSDEETVIMSPEYDYTQEYTLTDMHDNDDDIENYDLEEDGNIQDMDNQTVPDSLSETELNREFGFDNSTTSKSPNILQTDTENESFVAPGSHVRDSNYGENFGRYNLESESASTSHSQVTTEEKDFGNNEVDNSAMKNISMKRLVLKLDKIKFPISSSVPDSNYNEETIAEPLPDTQNSQLLEPESSQIVENNQEHFSRDDDLKILKELDRHIEHENLWGFTVWVVLASRFPGKTCDSLRDRFINHIFPSINEYVENSVSHIIRRLLENRLTMNNTQDNRNVSHISTPSTSTQADSNGRRTKYSHEEDRAIIDFLLENGREKEVGGKAVWDDIVREKINVLRGRSWHGLKERYKKRILPNLNMYPLSNSDKQKLLRN